MHEDIDWYYILWCAAWGVMYVHKGAWQIMVMLDKSAVRMGSLLIIIYIRNAQFKDSYMNIKLWMVYGVRELRK